MKKYIPYLIITVLLGMLVHQCENNSVLQKRSNSNTAALTDSLVKYKNRVGGISASKKVLELDNKQLKRMVLNKDAELKKLASEFLSIKQITKYKTITVIDTVAVVFQDSVMLPFERNGKLVTDWYSFDYTAGHKGFRLENLEIPNETTIITGFKREWLLGRPVLTASLSHSNPYVNITQLETVVVTVPQPWYGKWYVWFLAGLGGGILLN